MPQIQAIIDSISENSMIGLEVIEYHPFEPSAYDPTRANLYAYANQLASVRANPLRRADLHLRKPNSVSQSQYDQRVGF